MDRDSQFFPCVSEECVPISLSSSIQLVAWSHWPIGTTETSILSSLLQNMSRPAVSKRHKCRGRMYSMRRLSQRRQKQTAADVYRTKPVCDLLFIVVSLCTSLIDLVADVGWWKKEKKKKVFCPPAAKVFFFRLSWRHGFAIINLARRRYFCRSPRHRGKKKKKLKEDIAMLFGNDSWMTGKEMDSPSGWQFAARGAWMCACSKSGCCQEWLSPEFEPNSSRRREDSAPAAVLRRHNSHSALPFSLASGGRFQDLPQKQNKTKEKKKKVFERSLLWRETLPPSLCSGFYFLTLDFPLFTSTGRYRFYLRLPSHV